MNNKSITAEKVVLTSLVVDISDIVLSGIIAVISGSAIMLAESLQGLSDLVTVLFLYIGVKRSAKKPNRKFNFGYGRELYFWVFCSTIVMLIVTAGLSFYSGLNKFIDQTPIERTTWAYLILGVGVITNVYALSVSYRRIAATPTRVSIIKSFSSSRLIEVKTAFITDLMGSLSAAFGLVAIVLYGITGDVRFDGLGAMLVAAVIAIFSVVLMLEAKDMIIGRSVSSHERSKIKQAIVSNPEVLDVKNISTMQFGSEELYVNADISVPPKMTAGEVTKAIARIEESIRATDPTIDLIQIEIC